MIELKKYTQLFKNKKWALNVGAMLECNYNDSVNGRIEMVPEPGIRTWAK